MFEENQPGFKRLRSIISERTNRLVVWLGAGISIPAGLPSWPKLKEILCIELSNKFSGLDQDEEHKIKNIAENILKLDDFWLSFKMLKEHLGHATYRATIRDALHAAETCEIPDTYNSLWPQITVGLA